MSNGVSGLSPPSLEKKCAPEALSIYYQKHYPFQTVHRALTVGESNSDFAHGRKGEEREIILEWSGGRISRWNSLRSDPAGFKTFICEQNPERMEIGGAYAQAIEERSIRGKHGLTLLGRELVFDLDMDAAYDPYRVCGCSGSGICRGCWKLLAAGARFLDRILQHEFGCHRMLWVFSGRRGLHCWVFGQTCLSRAARAAILTRVDVLVESATSRNSRPLLPSVKAALVQMHADFEAYVSTHPTLMTACKEQIEVAIGDEVIIQEFRAILSDQAKRAGSAIDVWKSFRTMCNAPRLQPYTHSVVLAFCGPRLDRAVTEDARHPIKLPFCVHPSTGKLCLPLARESLFDFDPDANAVTLNDLVQGRKDCVQKFQRSVSAFEKEIS